MRKGDESSLLLRAGLLSIAMLPAAASADELQLALLFKTLAYDEALAARVPGSTLGVVAFGLPCTVVPAVAVSGRSMACRSANTLDQAVASAVAEPAVLLLGGESSPRVAAAVALASNLTVLSSTGAGLSESLLSLTAGRVSIGALALKRLGARFPANVLRTLQIIQPPPLPPPLPEFAFPPRPPADAKPGWPKGEKSQEAVVVIRVGVLESGKVSGLELIKGAPAFAMLAFTSVPAWTWEPARLDDKPIAASIVFRVVFHPP